MFAVRLGGSHFPQMKGGDVKGGKFQWLILWKHWCDRWHLMYIIIPVDLLCRVILADSKYVWNSLNMPNIKSENFMKIAQIPHSVLWANSPSCFPTDTFRHFRVRMAVFFGHAVKAREPQKVWNSEKYITTVSFQPRVNCGWLVFFAYLRRLNSWYRFLYIFNYIYIVPVKPINSHHWLELFNKWVA